MKRTFFLFVLVFSSLAFAARALVPVTYRGVIAQESESNPYEAYVYENNLGVVFSPVRVETGQYNLNVDKPIFASSGKVYMQTSLYNEGGDTTNLCLIKTRRWDNDTIRVSTFRQDESGFFVAADDCSYFIEITVFP